MSTTGPIIRSFPRMGYSAPEMSGLSTYTTRSAEWSLPDSFKRRVRGKSWLTNTKKPCSEPSLTQNCPYDLNKADNLFGYETSVLSGYGVKVLIVNYYDRYDFLSFEPFQYRGMDYVEDASFGVRHESTQGLLTGSYVRQLDNLGKGEFAVHYYDVRGREIQKRSSLLPSGHLDYTWTRYGFTGQPLCVKYKHSSAYGIYPYPPGDPRGDNGQEELYEYEYDNAGR